MQNSLQKIAVVTGGNRGLGFEICRQLAQQNICVILTSRDRTKGLEATKILQNEGLNIIFHPLEITDLRSVDRLTQFIDSQFNRIEILVNNAGIVIDSAETDSLLEVNLEKIYRTIETNFYGSLLMCRSLIPLMKSGNYGRIVNVSSGAGRLSGMEKMKKIFPSYSLSKAMLNAGTRILAAELKNTNILVNAVCPGWIKTDLGGPNALRSVEEGAKGIIWAATLPKDGFTGGLFYDGRLLNW
jgi:NAD(P)-dependent dehydrogenase (short-subunit alcohol dehydrogenase family)